MARSRTLFEPHKRKKINMERREERSSRNKEHQRSAVGTEAIGSHVSYFVGLADFEGKRAQLVF